jgi:hypothetical protein
LVMSASLSLWLINIAIPSLVGLLFIWRLKWKIKRKKISKPQHSKIKMEG